MAKLVQIGRATIVQNLLYWTYIGLNLHSPIEANTCGVLMSHNMFSN